MLITKHPIKSKFALLAITVSHKDIWPKYTQQAKLWVDISKRYINLYSASYKLRSRGLSISTFKNNLLCFSKIWHTVLYCNVWPHMVAGIESLFTVTVERLQCTVAFFLILTDWLKFTESWEAHAEVKCFQYLKLYSKLLLQQSNCTYINILLSKSFWIFSHHVG